MSDLKPTELAIQISPGSYRTPEESAVVVQKLFEYVTRRALSSIDWYYSKRNHKRVIGLILRYGSIIFVASAGILPILITIYEECDFNSAWSAVAVALAVLMIGIDKFGGFTSGWIRYMLAAQKLTYALEEFRFSWEEDKLKQTGTSVSFEDSQIMLNKCKEFLQKVQLIVSEETQKWVTEFQSALSDIELAAKAASESAQETTKTKEKGALLIHVTNGNLCVSPWTIELNDKVIFTNSGSSFAIPDLSPGNIKIKVCGIIDNKNVQDQKPAIIKGGEIITIDLTLS